MTQLPSAQDFFAAKEEPDDDGIPRDGRGNALIVPPEGYDGYRRKDGLVAYGRASGFGKTIEDTYYLDKWVQRQVVRGMALDPSLAPRAAEIPDPDSDESQKKARNAALDKIVEDAKEAAGANVKSRLGTAIHLGTELVDKGESLEGQPPIIVDRANAYWKFCRENNIVPTSVEVFGVQDDYQVAGTWDRTGWWQRKHKIVDVKTSSSMDFAGIAFSVQLACYAHMVAYDPATGARTPHEVMDLEEGVIIHVDRNMGGPVELYRVDLTAGWRWATLVNQISQARSDGRKAIKHVASSDPVGFAIANCQTLEQLNFVWQQCGPRWTADHAAQAQRVAAEIRGLGA